MVILMNQLETICYENALGLLHLKRFFWFQEQFCNERYDTILKHTAKFVSKILDGPACLSVRKSVKIITKNFEHAANKHFVYCCALNASTIVTLYTLEIYDVSVRKLVQIGRGTARLQESDETLATDAQLDGCGRDNMLVAMTTTTVTGTHRDEWHMNRFVQKGFPMRLLRKWID